MTAETSSESVRLYVVKLTETEMQFFRELFQSQIAVTLQNVEVVAELKRKLIATDPILSTKISET